jgi:hypothetical protein
MTMTHRLQKSTGIAAESKARVPGGGVAGVRSRTETEPRPSTDINVAAEPPAGQTIYKVPADFRTVDAMAERLTMKLEETSDTLKLSIHYGNRLRVFEAKN